MEAILFSDQAGFMSPVKNTATCDKSKLWLSLTNDCKNFVKKDDFDFTDLLHSPDFNITSPNVESLFLKSLESPPALKDTCLSPVFQQQGVCRSEACSVTAEQASVTREQEIFAQGFTDALKKIQRREEATKECDHTSQHVKQEPCDKKEENAMDNAKFCFISYNFDSSKPLPSFHEAFSRSTHELSISTCSVKSEYENITNAPQDCVFWDKIETVDEGFSLHSQTCSLREFTTATQESRDDESDVSISSPTLQSPLSGYNSQDNDDGVFHFPSELERDRSLVASDSSQEDEELLPNLQTNVDVPMEKHWLTVHTKLYNRRTVQDGLNQSDVMPLGFDLQGFIKTERKRQKNRLAAWKCRQKKLVRESRLETTVEELCAENAKLQEELDKLKRKRQRLQDTFNMHASGCSQAQVQYSKTALCPEMTS